MRPHEREISSWIAWFVSNSSILHSISSLSLVVEDYSDISGEGFTFQPFSTRDCITIGTVDDFVIESDERFIVSLLNPISAVTVTVGSPDAASVTISDNEEISAPPTTSGIWMLNFHARGIVSLITLLLRR